MHVGDVANRQRDLLLAAQLSFLEKDVRDLIIARIDDEALDLAANVGTGREPSFYPALSK